MPTRGTLVAVLSVLWLVPALAADWQTGFEQGLQGVSPYHREDPRTALSVGTDRPAEGAQYVIGALPGQRRLEGFSVSATGLATGRPVTVTAQVRGKGNLWFCLISGSRWLYSPGVMPLTDQWETVRLPKVLRAGESVLGIFFISQDVQQGAVFEVDDVQVTPAPTATSYDQAVPGYRLEAEDYCERESYAASVPGAFGGRALTSPDYLRAAPLPFPATGRPASVWARIKPASLGEELHLWTHQTGVGELLATARPAGSTDWQWVRFGAFTAGEIGDQFSVDFRPAKDVVDPSVLDALVVTAEDLAPEALGEVPPLLPGRPMVLVSPCEQAPVIDGAPDDPCWAQTIACGGFTTLRSSALAEGQTTARLCHDDTNLYVLFECAEPLLKTEMQRRHEFRAEVTERDGEIYDDDCCLILLDPGRDGKRVTDFTVNALGTLEDALCKEPDLWEARDETWNSGATAAGSIGEGKWSAELSVPLSDLGVEAPAEGEQWNVIIGRLARARGEQSSWNPSGAGFHAPEAMGTLNFGPAWGGLALSAPDSVQVGENKALAVLAQSTHEAGLTLATHITRGARSQHFTTCVARSGAAQTVEHVFQVKDEGISEIAHAAFDAGSLRPLYATSVRRLGAISTVASVELSCEGPFKLYLNERKIAEGPKAAQQAISVALQGGENVFALAVEGGTARARIIPPTALPVESHWKLAPEDKLDAIGVNVDDSGWENAPVAEGVMGAAGKPALLRHTLLWTKTRVWPTPEPALYIARDSAQHITLICDGIKGKLQREWSWYVALPEGFEVIDATGYYGNVSYQPQFICTDLGPQAIDGKPLHVWKVSATKPIQSGRHYIMSLFNVMVRHTGGAATPEESRFLLWSAGNDGAMTEPAQVINVRLCEALRGKQPKELELQLWGSFFGNADSEAVRRATLETARAAGFNNMVSGDRWTGETSHEYGMTHTTGITFAGWSIGLKEYLTEHPEMRLTAADGRLNDSQMCMSCVLDEGWGAIRDKLTGIMASCPADVYDYDYEFSPFTGPHACYCERCLQAFRERAGLPPDGPVLAPETIRERHSDKWVEFMTWRVAVLFRKFRDAVHEIDPDAKFSTYSGYQMPDTAVRYGVDWMLIGDLQACDVVGCGYGRPVPAVVDTVAALQGIPALYGELVYPYDTAELMPVRPVTEANLLRRFLDSTGGALVYDRLPLDGRSWFSIGEVSRLVADCEEVFLKGKRQPLTGVDEASGVVLTDGATTLLCLLNTAGKAQTYRFTIPEGLVEGREYYSGEAVRAGEQMEVVVPAGETVAYVFRN